MTVGLQSKPTGVSPFGAIGEDCAAPIQFIYPDPDADPNWSKESSVAWNHNGTQMAFFEILQPRDSEQDQVRIVVLEHQDSSWQRVREVGTDIELFGKWPFGPDWQRDGSLLALMTREGDGPQGINRITLVTLEDRPELGLLAGDWWYEVEGSGVSWSPDNSQLLFQNERDQLVKWTYPGGPGEVLVPGEGPDWQRNELTQLCSLPAHCDDSDPCTKDECTDGDCAYSASFDTCDDLNECTVSDGCDEFLVCSGIRLDDGVDCSAGYCCGARCIDPCIQCDEGDSCTIDTCTPNFEQPCSPTCSYSPDPACQCLSKGDDCTQDSECCSGQCHPRKGTCK